MSLKQRYYQYKKSWMAVVIISMLLVTISGLGVGLLYRNKEKHTRATKVRIEPLTGMIFLWIEEGCFEMGSPRYIVDHNLEEGPVHPVCVKGFWMAKYEVTQEQWQKMMGYNPSHFTGQKNAHNYPVENVSWNEAQAFLSELNTRTGLHAFRLPSEAEWEYAARAGAQTTYAFGDDVSKLPEYEWCKGNSDNRTHPVGQLKPNAWGLHDMYGNVLEWCQDIWHQNYEGAPSDGSVWESGDHPYRLLRGGAWSYPERYCHCTNRDGDYPDKKRSHYGFRVAADTSMWADSPQ